MNLLLLGHSEDAVFATGNTRLKGISDRIPRMTWRN